MRNSYIFNRDLKDLRPDQVPESRRPVLVWVRIAGIAVASAALWLTSVTIASISYAPDAERLSTAPAADPTLATPPAQLLRLTLAGDGERVVHLPAAVIDDLAVLADPAGATPNWRNHDIVSGDTLEKILVGAGVGNDDIHLLTASPDGRLLNRLIAGHRIHFQVTNGRLQQLYYDLDPEARLRAVRDAAGNLDVTLETRDLERRLRNVSATITSSLFEAGVDAGLSDALILKMVEIFGWDVDFVLDLRRGDSFAVVYEELYEGGVMVGSGDILAAEFVNQGQVFRAIRRLDENGHAEYYTPEGESVRREFLKSPVKFTRISSRFSGSRYHPVLNRWRAHRGVDYAAPRGTPVVSTAVGKVMFIGSKGGYGNTVVIRHGGQYSTLYGHLNSFQKGLRMGQSVRQGEVVGYVGATGLATGPHLHYEFRVNGTHTDPLSFKHPRAEPLTLSLRDEFRERARHWEHRLDLISRSLAPLQAATAGPTGDPSGS